MILQKYQKSRRVRVSAACCDHRPGPDKQQSETLEQVELHVSVERSTPALSDLSGLSTITQKKNGEEFFPLQAAPATSGPSKGFSKADLRGANK